jgi:addiction module HigA family antidote
MTKLYEFEPDYTVPPGETLKEIEKNLGLSTKDFATELNTTSSHLRQVYSGDKPITIELARRIGSFTKIYSKIWMNLQEQYDKYKKLQEKENE